MNERNMLLDRIRQYSFTLKELDLYLDTHPNCRNALNMFKKYKKFHEEAVNDYISRFGPIMPEQNRNDRHWDWIDDPWPWERS